jgi:hypothetical protein
MFHSHCLLQFSVYSFELLAYTWRLRYIHFCGIRCHPAATFEPPRLLGTNSILITSGNAVSKSVVWRNPHGLAYGVAGLALAAFASVSPGAWHAVWGNADAPRIQAPAMVGAAMIPSRMTNDDALAAIRAETLAPAVIDAEPAFIAEAPAAPDAAVPAVTKITAAVPAFEAPVTPVDTAESTVGMTTGPDEAPSGTPIADVVPVAPPPPVVAVPSKPSAAPLAWGAKVSPEFREKVRAMCGRLGCQPDHLMAAMAFESVETFSPGVRNPMSGATGLIQFMADTARNLGTSQDDLSEMTAEEQLAYVEKYFQPFKGHLSTLEDVYMAILWPRAVGKANDFVLFAEGTKQYEQNSALDKDLDGEITKQETAAIVTATLHKGMRPQNSF